MAGVGYWNLTCHHDTMAQGSVNTAHMPRIMFAHKSGFLDLEDIWQKPGGPLQLKLNSLFIIVLSGRDEQSDRRGRTSAQPVCSPWVSTSTADSAQNTPNFTIRIQNLACGKSNQLGRGFHYCFLQWMKYFRGFFSEEIICPKWTEWFGILGSVGLDTWNEEEYCNPAVKKTLLNAWAPGTQTFCVKITILTTGRTLEIDIRNFSFVMKVFVWAFAVYSRTMDGVSLGGS